MKKVFTLFVMSLIGCEAFAGACGSGKIVLEGMFQYPSDDEFLFDSEEAYKSAPESNGEHPINGKVWECDNEYCPGGEKITLVAGHVFKGEVVKETKTYECYTNGLYDSHWVEVEETFMCGETHISYDGINQGADDNEFLYSTDVAYNSAKNRGDGGTIAGGLVYECDDKHCKHNEVQPMAAGHVFKGETISEARKYRCVHSATDDYWEVIYEGCLYSGKNINIGSWYEDSNGKRVDLNYAQCSQFQDMNPADSEKKFNAKCELFGGEAKMRCYPIGDGDDKISECPAGSSEKILSQKDCKSGERFECAKYGAPNQCVCGKCIANGGERRDDGNRTVGKCHPSVCTSEICKECCKRPASQTIWDRTAQVCQCVNGGKFQKENGTWICKVDAGAVVPGDAYVCDAALMAKMDGWRAQCAAKADVLELITELEEYCKGKPDKDVFLRLYDEVADAAKQCVTAAPIDDGAEKLRVSRRKISDAHGILVGMREMFKTSVWKDEEGKFNTSRLVSDSIAGVVLGTVGGVVTSNVVKKNQVEDGFEDIKCTIGGQTVAEWGDQFRVGIQ